MWREQLDVFWDGERTLLLGFFEPGESDAPKAPRPDLTIVSASDPDFSAGTAFVDRLDASRWRAGSCLIVAPSGHRHLALLAPDGAELRLTLETDEGDVGEWRLALTLLPDSANMGPAGVHIASFSGRGDFERFAREQFALGGARLVWACGHKRLFGRSDSAQLLHVWPTQQMFPASRARLSLERLEYSPDGFEDRREAPFAIMEQWLREGGAPRAGLRLRLSESLEESAHLLGRIGVVLVMHQRRRLRDWMREQRDVGEPIVQPLFFDDIRQATGAPEEYPDAVWSHEPIVVFNLLRLLTAPDDAPFDGLAVRRLPPVGSPPNLGASSPGLALELDFYGAALGDDIGLVSLSAETGELSVHPRDPGGASNIRLFRVEGDGVNPRKVGEDDPLIGEILRCASQEESAPVGAMSRAMVERAAALHARREKLVQSLNGALARLDYPGGFDLFGFWEPLEPLLLINFVALLKEANVAGRALASRLGGYRAYRIDPSLVASLVLRPQWGEGIGAPLRGDAKAPLVYRFAQACGAEGLVAPEATVAEQARIFDLLAETPEPQKLCAARLTLDGQANVDPSKIAAQLSDVVALEKAFAFYEEQGRIQSAGALRGYLDNRAKGVFTPLEQAASLVEIVAQAKEALARATLEGIEAPEPVAPPKPKGLFAAVRGFFGGGKN
jgi:hypothetical protein